MDAKTFRDNLFQMNTRRFGTVMELLVKKVSNTEYGTNIHHDLDTDIGTRIEVKFSRVEEKHSTNITEANVLDLIENECLSIRIFPFGEWRSHKFDCNIQQVKKSEFDTLMYGLCFADRVMIFIATPEEIGSGMKYCDRQHKGNKGEGQFHINQTNLDYHIKNHLFVTLSYADILAILGE